MTSRRAAGQSLTFFYSVDYNNTWGWVAVFLLFLFSFLFKQTHIFRAICSAGHCQNGNWIVQGLVEQGRRTGTIRTGTSCTRWCSNLLQHCEWDWVRRRLGRFWSCNRPPASKLKTDAPSANRSIKALCVGSGLGLDPIVFLDPDRVLNPDPRSRSQRRSAKIFYV
jgi:hypothetical protein